MPGPGLTSGVPSNFIPQQAFGDFFFAFSAMAVVIFVVFILVIVFIVGRASNTNRSHAFEGGTTAFPPPPPPDTVMVRCAYCGTTQRFSEKCSDCGAPLPKPSL